MNNRRPIVFLAALFTVQMISALDIVFRYDDPHLHIVTKDGLYNRDKSFDAARIEANLHHPLLTKLLYTRPIILPTDDANRLRLIDLLLHLFLVVLIAGIGALVLRKAAWQYWAVQAVILLFAGMQTWCQFVMPKVGLFLILIAAIIVVCRFYYIQKKNRSLHERTLIHRHSYGKERRIGK